MGLVLNLWEAHKCNDDVNSWIESKCVIICFKNSLLYYDIIMRIVVNGCYHLLQIKFIH